MLSCRSEWWENAGPVSAHHNLKPFSCCFSFPFCKAHLNCCWVLSCNFMESPTHNKRLLNGSSLEFAIVFGIVSLYYLKKNLVFLTQNFLPALVLNPCHEVKLFIFRCLSGVTDLIKLIQPPYQIMNDYWGVLVLAFQKWSPFVKKPD